MQLTALLPLFLLALSLVGCGGRTSEGPDLQLAIDGEEQEVEGASLGVPFLQHLLRIESDADSIEVTGAKAELVEVKSKLGVGVDVPLRVGDNKLQVRLLRGRDSQSFELKVKRKDFETITYVKAEQPNGVGLLGRNLGASGVRICASHSTVESREILSYLRRDDGSWLAEGRLAVEDRELGQETPLCRLEGNSAVLVGLSITVHKFDEDQGEWHQEVELERPAGEVNAVWGKNHLFVAHTDEQRVLVYRTGQWDEPEATLVPQAGEVEDFGREMSAHENALLIGGSLPDSEGTPLFHLAQNDEEEWSINSMDVEDTSLQGAPFVLASEKQAYFTYQDDDTMGVAQLDLVDGAWDSKRVIQKRDDGASFEGIYYLSMTRDLLFLSADDSLGGTGVNPPYEGYAHLSGAVFAFEKTEEGFQQAAYLKASYHPTSSRDMESPMLGEMFGVSCDIGNDFLAVSAINDASKSAGIGADPEDESMPGAGAVWVFE